MDNNVECQNDDSLFISHILDTIITQITNSVYSNDKQDIKSIIGEQYNKNYNIYQGKCYQQHSPNLCGYHANFNAFCFIKLLEEGICQYDIKSCGSFWKFKIKIQKFLTQYKTTHKLKDQWPWRTQDIITGDFQRIYHKICIQEFEHFNIFKDNQKFTYLSHIWTFQYNNLLLQQDKQLQISKSFMKFKQYEGEKPLILHLMLGITTHWLVFFAIKSRDKTEYWFFDSQNQPYLDYNQQQIRQYIQRCSKQVVKYGRKQSTKFEKQADCQCIRDIQKSLKLIINCLQGKQTLESFQYNRRFSIFADKLCSSLDNLQNASILIKQYQFDISQFLLLKIQSHLFYEENKNKMEQLIKLADQIKDYSEEGTFFHSLIQMQKQFQ